MWKWLKKYLFLNFHQSPSTFQKTFEILKLPNVVCGKASKIQFCEKLYNYFRTSKIYYEEGLNMFEKISKQIILSSTLCAYFFRKILKFSTIILDSFRTVWFETLYFSTYLFEVRTWAFWMFWFKIRYFSNILVRNTISFPMFSMQIRYCSNVLGSKSHCSNVLVQN